MHRNSDLKTKSGPSGHNDHRATLPPILDTGTWGIPHRSDFDVGDLALDRTQDLGPAAVAVRGITIREIALLKSPEFVGSNCPILPRGCSTARFREPRLIDPLPRGSHRPAGKVGHKLNRVVADL